MRWLTLLTLPLLFNSSIRADEKDEQVAKQKAKALEILKKCGIETPGLIETQDLIVCGPLPEDKLKTMGEVVQRRYAAAYKALKFELSENPAGKLSIFFFPERKKFSFFFNEMVGELPQKDERSHADGRAELPFVAVSVLPGQKPTDLEAEAGAQLAAALLQVKAGPTKLPAWMVAGFQQAMKWRNDPRSAERAAAKTLVRGHKITDVWMGETSAKDKSLLAASLMEYLVFSPASDKLSKVLVGFRPVEGEPAPTVESALKGADFTIPGLEASWKRWVDSAK